jgi:hypothetical protein
MPHHTASPQTNPLTAPTPRNADHEPASRRAQDRRGLAAVHSQYGALLRKPSDHASTSDRATLRLHSAADVGIATDRALPDARAPSDNEQQDAKALGPYLLGPRHFHCLRKIATTIDPRPEDFTSLTMFHLVEMDLAQRDARGNMILTRRGASLLGIQTPS